jgi:hypothetical protein
VDTSYDRERERELEHHQEHEPYIQMQEHVRTCTLQKSHVGIFQIPT